MLICQPRSPVLYDGSQLVVESVEFAENVAVQRHNVAERSRRSLLLIGAAFLRLSRARLGELAGDALFKRSLQLLHC